MRSVSGYVSMDRCTDLAGLEMDDFTHAARQMSEFGDTCLKVVRQKKRDKNRALWNFLERELQDVAAMWDKDIELWTYIED